MPSRSALLAVGAVIVCAGLLLLVRRQPSTVTLSDARRASVASCSQVATAFRDHTASGWVTVTGHVVQLLPDEQGRYRHQRFVLRCSSGQTVLIVNDISVGARVPVRRGDLVSVHGEYVWNALGGLVHYTHHSDQGGAGGWILYHDRVYAWISFRTKTWKTVPRGAGDVDDSALTHAAYEPARVTPAWGYLLRRSRGRSVPRLPSAI